MNKTTTQPTRAKVPTDIRSISEALGLRRISDYRWEGTYCTGQFDALSDYGVGLLSVFISLSVDEADHTRLCPMFGLSTIDDGVWQAFNPLLSYSREEASAQIDIMANTFIAYMEKHCGTVLPTEAELNKFLQQFNLWGEYTG